MIEQLRLNLISIAIVFLAQITLAITPSPSPTPTPDRRQQAEEAANQGSKETKKQLTPPMLGHLGRAEEARKKADELQSTDPAAAQRERERALAEQQQANQLKQQIDANQKSSEENKKSADKMRDTDRAPKAADAPKIKTGVDENKVIVVSDETKKAQNAQGQKTHGNSDSKTELSPLQKELTSFADYVTPKKPTAELEKNSDPKPTVPQEPVTNFHTAPWQSELNYAQEKQNQVASEEKKGDPASASHHRPGSETLTSPRGFEATPLLLKKSGTEDNGLDKDFFVSKKKTLAKKKKPGRAMANRGKGSAVRLLGSASQTPSIAKVTNGEAPLRTDGKLKD